MGLAKLFRKARVFGTLVPIFKVKGLLDGSAIPDLGSAYGYFQDDTKEIGVDAGLRGDALEGTVLHELFHATLDRLHIQQQLSRQMVEVIVENLAVAVVDNYHLRWRK